MSWLLEGRPLDAILISRLRYLGDVVMATPLLEVLRHGDPAVRLGFLAESNHGIVLENHPHLDQIHFLNSTRRGKDAQARGKEPQSNDSFSFWPMVSQLRSAKYDLAVDLLFNPRSAWLLKMAGIPHRIGGTRGSRRWLFSHTVVTDPTASPFQRLFQMAPGGLGEHLARLVPLVHQETGLGFIDWLEQEYVGKIIRPKLPHSYWATKAPESWRTDKPVVLAPGATWASKEWPLSHWKTLIRKLLLATDNPVLVVQPPGRNGIWDEIRQDIPSSRGGLLPVSGLTEILGVISKSALLVSVDGGIMHSGVGLGVPTLGLFGPTDPQLWFPYIGSGPFRVLATGPNCAPCDRHECDQFICLPDLAPDLVLSHCLALLSNGSEGDGP